MGVYEIKELKAEPEFDLYYYLEVCGETRLDHELAEEFAPQWDQWLQYLKAYSLNNTEGAGQFLILFLEKPVEEVIEGIWQDSPASGLAFHNLAITMVMSAAQGLVPELMEKGCAPLPKPGQGVRDAFAQLGLTWNPEGTVNRQYAVFTPYPYNGGCEICFLSDKCPKAVKPH